MTMNQFVRHYRVRPADAVIVKKDFIGLLDHYLIYLGVDNYGEHKFIANYTKGVKVLTNQELRKFAAYLSPDRIKWFKGNEMQRLTALQRALSRKDQQSYHLILNNCEHYSNYVQHGTNYSQQTKNLGKGLTLAGIATAAIAGKDNPNTRNTGLVLAGLGLLTLLLDND